MYRNRVIRAGAFLAAATALAGAPGSAHAQASGTLQATAVVLDDAVSRELTARLERLADNQSIDQAVGSLPGHPVALRVDDSSPAAETPRRVRIDLIYM
ncbi:MAG TPA: hypothetical protein VF037_11680 [Gemmatimonadales bacterium]